MSRHYWIIALAAAGFSSSVALAQMSPPVTVTTPNVSPPATQGVSDAVAKPMGKAAQEQKAIEDKAKAKVPSAGGDIKPAEVAPAAPSK
jgi:hypothetical protein